MVVVLDQSDINNWNGGAISCFCLSFPATHLSFVWGLSGLVLLNIRITNCITDSAQHSHSVCSIRQHNTIPSLIFIQLWHFNINLVLFSKHQVHRTFQPGLDTESLLAYRLQIFYQILWWRLGGIKAESKIQGFIYFESIISFEIKIWSLNDHCLQRIKTTFVLVRPC